MPNDELTLTVGGRELRGWKEVRVTRGVERMPSDFEIAVTERYPGEAARVFAEPGAECEVRLGGDLVLTGYVDRLAPSLDARAHKVGVFGRGRCQDLVDCAADIRGNQLSAVNAAELARRLAAVYGIEVVPPAGDQGPTIPQFNFNQTETGWEIIERVARFAAFLTYEDARGRLVLARVGAERMASGFREGVNVERAAVAYSMDQRYSEYRVILLPIENLADVGRATGGPLTFNEIARVRDETVPRKRLRMIVVEAHQQGIEIARQRARWEMARRYGRSQAVVLTCDSWRDAAGRLWEPNALAPVHLPALKLEHRTWVIAEVTYRRGEEGTHADLVLMPPEAFEPEPTILRPYDWQVAEELRRSGAAAGAAAGGGGPIP